MTTPKRGLVRSCDPCTGLQVWFVISTVFSKLSVY